MRNAPAIVLGLGIAALLGLVVGWFVPGLLLLVGILVLAIIVIAGRRMVELARERDREHAQATLLESTLEAQRNAIDTLAEGLEVAIFLCDAKGVIQYANRKAADMFRFPAPAGRSILAVTLSYDLERLVLECVRSGDPKHAELAFSYPDGRTAQAAAWPERGGDRIFLSLYETTDLRKLERVRQDFVANVSHELRTPLTTIRAMAETLQEEPDNADLRARYLANIVSEVDRLSLLANDLLVLTSSESSPVRKHACDIAEVVQAIVQQLMRKAASKGLELTYTGPERLIVEANAAQMSQVVINLVDNAIGYTNEGSVHVSLSQDDDQVVLAVRDTGIGIASEHLPRIFERFYRVDKARGRSTGGTGLGLSIVKHIVEVHGGQVNVQSALNEGSTFMVRLPVGSEQVDEA